MENILCLPREDSFLHAQPPIEEKHPDWKLITCPVCGDGCYVSPDHERALKSIPGLKAACTQCALQGKSNSPKTKTMRIKLDINMLYAKIDDVLGSSRSKVVQENGHSIAVGLELLASYLREIAERAIEINDDYLIDLLLDLHVLKRED